jgi:CheY-like chemotaxis protein
LRSKVLIVDDDPAVVELMRIYLEDSIDEVRVLSE